MILSRWAGAAALSRNYNGKLSQMNLDLRNPSDLRGLPSEYAELITNCASLCLDYHRHPQQVMLRVEGLRRTEYALRWNPQAPRRRIFYGVEGHNDTIRWGAECVAIHIVPRWLGLAVVKAGARGTGADFFLGQPGLASGSYRGCQWTMMKESIGAG